MGEGNTENTCGDDGRRGRSARGKREKKGDTRGEEEEEEKESAVFMYSKCSAINKILQIQVIKLMVRHC